MSDDFRHRTLVEVRFRDIDAFGHVNNAVIASYIEQARVSYLHDVLDFEPVGRMPMILAMLQIDYAAPVFWGEGVGVDSRVDWVGRSSLGMAHRVVDTGDGHALASASSVLVAYDYAENRPMAVPEDWRRRLVAHEGRTLEKTAAGS
jgi:acyl-CoA thioester hydrolase